MNYDGTLTVVRGQEAAYFISPDLRLQGLTGIPLAASGAGASEPLPHPSTAMVSARARPRGRFAMSIFLP